MYWRHYGSWDSHKSIQSKRSRICTKSTSPNRNAEFTLAKHGQILANRTINYIKPQKMCWDRLTMGSSSPGNTNL